MRGLAKKVLVVGTVCLLLVAATFGVAKAVSETAVRKTDKYTEMYFSQYEALAKQVEPGKSYQGWFTIVNKLDTDHVYTYRVSLVKDGKVMLRTQRNLRVPQNTPFNVPFSYQVAAAGEKVDVVIDLVGEPQQLHLKVRA